MQQNSRIQVQSPHQPALTRDDAIHTIRTYERLCLNANSRGADRYAVIRGLDVQDFLAGPHFRPGALGAVNKCRVELRSKHSTH
jgi:hypothetical protein